MAADSTARTQLVVIGAGPGGYAAAFHAADHGMQVTLVDRDLSLGGVCLNRGCIPSKALLHLAKLLNETKEAHEFGVTFGKPQIDLKTLRDWKGGIVQKLSSSIGELCQRRGVQVLTAQASFISSNQLALTAPPGGSYSGPATLEFEHAILATGSSPAIPPIFQVNDPRVMDSTGALQLEEIPKKLLVVGGGYIGLEMGSVYASLGSEVTVVELTDGLLPGCDRDLVRPLQKRLESTLHKIHLNTKVAALKPEKGGVKAELEGQDVPKSLLFDRVLVAIGRRPNTRDLGLEKTQVTVDAKGFITVDDKMRSTDPHILAIGDIAGEPMLAHKATREGKIAVEGLAGLPAAFDIIAMPAVVFTDPEIAWCGLTENQARAEGREVTVVRFPWAASGRARTLARTEGLTKLICEPKTERVLGMGVVGAGAGELIAEGVLAVEMAAVARDIADSVHPHPTLSETVMEASESVFGSATHMFRPRK